MKSEWQVCTIGELCDSVSVTYRGEDERVVLVNTSDVLNGKVLNHTDEPNQNLKGQFKKTFKKNDILYSEIRPANRRFAFIDFDETEKYIASTKLMVIRYRENVVEPKFLYFLLTSNDVIGELQRLAETRSGTFPQITFPAEVATLPVNLPPLPIQRKIASILSDLDDKIETNNAICRNLEEQAMALYKSWFVDFEPFGGIAPDKWEKGILGDFISCNPQLTKGKYMGTFIDMKALPTSGYRISTFLHKIKATGTKFQNGDVLMARITPCLENGKTGIVWGLEEDEVGRGSTEFIVLRGKEAPLTSYIACLSRDDAFRDYAIKRMNGSSGRQRVQASDIIQYPILVPSKEVLCRFENTVSSFLGGIKARSDENDYLSKLRDTLLPKLMSGELEVETLV